jgi:addiction module HigA family antidote
MTMSPRAVHPGRVLHDEVMKPLGISRNKLARDIDVPVGRISAIVSGTRAVTADTALRLAKYFGTTPELWLKLQSDYDLDVARATVWWRIDPRVRVLEEPAPASIASASVQAVAQPSQPVSAQPAVEAAQPVPAQAAAEPAEEAEPSDAPNPAPGEPNAA